MLKGSRVATNRRPANIKDAMKILYQFASRSRPQNFFTGMDSIVKNSISTDYRIHVVADWDDHSMNDSATIARLKEYPNTEMCLGKSKNKIHAINRLPHIKEQIIVNMSDDMVFTHNGFDEIIRQGFKDYFPFLDGVLHFNDGRQRDNCMTMSIIGIAHFRKDGYIYHPSYESLWCDLEAQDVAKKRGKYHYMGDSLQIFKHLHPSFGDAPMDKQYEKTESWEVRSKDEEVYRKRKVNNFPL